MSSILESKVLSMLGLMVKMLKHGMTCLQSMWMNLLQTTFTVRDIQRCWLEITAFLDYMLVFKPPNPVKECRSLHTPIHFI
jgi:hypothetical protein